MSPNLIFLHIKDVCIMARMVGPDYQLLYSGRYINEKCYCGQIRNSCGCDFKKELPENGVCCVVTKLEGDI